MKRYIQYEPFNIYTFEASEWPHPVHNHSYFEIIFIRSGRGNHCINDNSFHYSAGDVFLLGPEDYHYFEIAELTEFCYIRFTEVFLEDHTQPKSPNWIRTVESLLNSPYQSCGSLVADRQEKTLLEHLLTVLIHEYTHREEGSYDLIMNGIMKAILGILARNGVREDLVKRKDIKSAKLIEDIVLYVRQHIREPEQLRIEHLVGRFNYSASYLSALFKTQTGESLQQYILKYKLKLIENRLLYSSLSVSQITYEFGFTDGSHLNKLFKKYYGMTPNEFRHSLSGKDEKSVG
ncbi:AraC family transcriptional regulator [Telluribacter sp.]|jgi:YesN/AraC family two-component response regulator|uniref:AraC family transcriptional regulator n=1 Tax=Telluribacter sp. TaxID=1978767 RepID=UPI002E15E349|nr:AraC family transcriptional regulator [Telluribacter sp.]